jgi:hypothetical protein
MNELPIPDGVENDPNATEMLRLWAANGRLNVSINLGAYEEQGHDEAFAWGIIITDFARHVARGLSRRYGRNDEQVLARIRDGFVNEIEKPTSDVKGDWK